jgi:hypothetical protein
MHRRIVGNAYGEKDRGSWNPDYLVFKLVTVATDNAIARGPGLFLNRDLTTALVSYRQVIGHLNQLIDKATDFQVVAELWRSPQPADQVLAAKQLVESVHIVGIGNEGLEQKPAAFQFFKLVTEQLRIENESRVIRWTWAITAVNVGGWGAWIVGRVQWARRPLATAWLRVVRIVAARTPTTPRPAPPAPEPLTLSTANDAQSNDFASPVDASYIYEASTSSTPVSSTSSWHDQARLPLAGHPVTGVDTEQPATRRRKLTKRH